MQGGRFCSPTRVLLLANEGAFATRLMTECYEGALGLFNHFELFAYLYEGSDAFVEVLTLVAGR